MEAGHFLGSVVCRPQLFEVGSIGGSGAAAAEAPWQHDMPRNEG